jgi:hypothetical protein
MLGRLQERTGTDESQMTKSKDRREKKKREEEQQKEYGLLVMFSLCFEKHKRKQWDSGKEER